MLNLTNAFIVKKTGTRIIYELDQMMKLRHSPLSQTPPANLVYVEGITKGVEMNKNQNLKNIMDLNNNRFSPKPQKIVEGKCLPAVEKQSLSFKI